MKKLPLILATAFILVACQLFTPQPAATPAPSQPAAATAVPPSPTPAAPTSGEKLPPIQVNVARPFAGIRLEKWSPPGPSQLGPALPVELERITNAGVIEGLTESQRAFLSRNGFAVLHTGEAQFSQIRDQVAKYYGQPYYLTTDAAYHALHLTFDDLLKALEREQLRPRLLALTQATLAEVLSYLPQVQSSAIEEDTRLAAAYLAVGLKLLDPQAQVDPQLEPQVSAQLAQIAAGGGVEVSALIPGFKDDYGAYKPVGHYADDPELEAYFRGMTWFGRVHFKLKDPADPAFRPSRAPLIITLALRQARLEDGPASDAWGMIHEVLTYLIGPSDDAGPLEYSAFMDEIYPGLTTVAGLSDEARWQEFLRRSGEIPAPQINSTFADSTIELQAGQGWRLMGQRFTLDAFIFQNLIYDKVGDPTRQRELPSGLDVMAALGSPAARQALEDAGETTYVNYPQQMERLQQAVQAQSEEQWLSHFYSGWLYAFFPQLAGKDSSYPAYMQTPAWGYKDLNSALGSWAELKHDTVLYTKMPEFMGGGGPPSSGPPPAFVEPNPEVFFRLAYLAESISQGLEMRGMGLQQAAPTLPDGQTELSFNDLLSGTQLLAEQFKRLGNIAAKQLSGAALEEGDYEWILSCLGPVECAVERAQYYGQQQELPPVPVVAAVSGAKDRILEVATGKVDRIYVIVLVNGELQVAQGGVFTYYEFPQPRDNRLTDSEWRQKLETNPPDLPQWTAAFLSQGGLPTNALAFRLGDVYLITEEGGSPPLNMRSSPSTASAIVHKLNAGDYVTLIEGPVQAGGYTWWKAQLPYSEEITGWVVENQAWFERAWGQ